MAKNFVQDGTTIELVNAGDQTILSGAAVVVGSMVAVAITDIPAGEAGDGFAEGVFLLPKQSADDIQSGAVGLSEGRGCAVGCRRCGGRGGSLGKCSCKQRHCGGKNQCLICLRECVAGWTWRPFG